MHLQYHTFLLHFCIIIADKWNKDWKMFGYNFVLPSKTSVTELGLNPGPPGHSAAASAGDKF